MYNIYILYGIIHIVEGKMENIEEKKCECGCDKEHCDAAMMNQWYLKWKILTVKR